MLFWKRVEIYSGYSQKEFSELRNTLAAQGIRYDYRIENLVPPRGNTIGVNLNYQNMYYLYIHKNDYDKAMYHTSNRHAYSGGH